MRSKLILILLASGVAACNTLPDEPARGVAAVNVPVVTNANYTFDAAAPDGALSPGEAERLNGWFQGLGVGYGDSVYVDGAAADMARAQVAEVAGRYGLLVTPGAPVTAGYVQPGMIRVVVNRRRAEVPGCPNWSRPASPDYNNLSMSNYGCAVNSNLAAMIADPVDLIHGREGTGVNDGATAVKAIDLYRKTPPTGSMGLQQSTTKGGN